jgi:hypothetical protein
MTSNKHEIPAAAILLIPVAVAAVVTLFAWPNARIAPRHLPIGVAGPGAAVAAERLAGQGDAFDVHRYADEGAARRAIEDRAVYGAFVTTSTGAEVLMASAASPAVAQLLDHAATSLAGEQEAVPVEDVVAAPRGGALASSVLPLVLAGLLTGALVAAISSRRGTRVALLVTGSALAGCTAAAIVQSWLEVVHGNWTVNAAVLSLTVAAIALAVAGAEHLLGGKGIALVGLTMVLVGNPFSAVGAAPELLPRPAGTIGQLLPPGAGGNLLRSTGFFDGAASGGHLAVLIAWAAAGMLMLLLPRRRAATALTAEPAVVGM